MKPHPSEPHSNWPRELFDNSPDAILIQDEDGHIIAANKVMLNMVGLETSEIIGRPLLDFLPKQWQARWQHDLEMLISGQWNIFETSILNTKLDRETHVDLTIITRSTFDGRSALFLHLHNLSLYHTIEKALMASQEQWDMSFDAITECMCILGHNGVILRANRAMTERFEIQEGKELHGLAFSEVLSPPSTRTSAPAMPHPVKEAPFQIKKTEFNGIEGWFNVASYPLRNPQNELIGAVLILRDITAQLQIEKALRKSELSLRQTSKMEAVGRLAGGIAHDFNNMLTSILGYSSMAIKNLPPDSSLRNDMREIINAAERATSLTRQLLNFSHDRAIETESVDLNGIITNIKGFLKHTLGKNIQIEMRLDNDLKPIKADVSHLEQILVNLAINARDAMQGNGRFMIETHNFEATPPFCRVHPGIRPDNYVLLEISDTGQGIPPDMLEHIFEPFFTTKPRGKGTGLGLTNVYSIIQQFKGCIQCYSEINKGTTFKMFLPQDDARTGAAAQPEPDQSEMPGGKETILVIDDEVNIVNMIKHILSDLGYTVIPATFCSEALTAAENYSGKIDLVLSDIIMPSKSGVELVEELRATRPGLKVLYMSGYANNAATQIGQMPADTTFLQKPFSFELMAKRVRETLDKESQEG